MNCGTTMKSLHGMIPSHTRELQNFSRHFLITSTYRQTLSTIAFLRLK